MFFISVSRKLILHFTLNSQDAHVSSHIALKSLYWIWTYLCSSKHRNKLFSELVRSVRAVILHKYLLAPYTALARRVFLCAAAKLLEGNLQRRPRDPRPGPRGFVRYRFISRKLGWREPGYLSGRAPRRVACLRSRKYLELLLSSISMQRRHQKVFAVESTPAKLNPRNTFKIFTKYVRFA